MLCVGKQSCAQDCALGDTIPYDESTYRVALMLPLYLEQVDAAFFEEAPNNKMLQLKPFSFLHFYEGFMIAVDSMVSSRGLKLDLKVYDVDNDVSKAVTAIEDPYLENVDLIVGPFYIKPFEKVMEFAVQNNILIVNPITQRSNIVDNQPNVIKVKPSMESQVDYLEVLMKNYYHSNSVFIISRDGVQDSVMIARINEIVDKTIDSVSYVDNKHILNVIKKYRRRMAMLKVDIKDEGIVSDNINLDEEMLKRNIDDSTAFDNFVMNVNYSRDSLHDVKRYASLLRNNFVIVYGNDRIFADEIVNKVTKLTEYYPITVVMLPEWSKFERLFNENLMKMKAIYFDDNYVDYKSIRVMSFVNKFRKKYGTEPQEYAFNGFDIGWYFLNALNDKGDNMSEALQNYEIPLLQTQFRLRKTADNNGYENAFWNVYQFKGYNKIPVELEVAE